MLASPIVVVLEPEPIPPSEGEDVPPPPQPAIEAKTHDKATNLMLFFKTLSQKQTKNQKTLKFSLSLMPAKIRRNCRFMVQRTYWRRRPILVSL